MEKPATAARASATRLAPPPLDESDLVPRSVAERELGLSKGAVDHWIKQGRVPIRGRGSRRAILVALPEVRAAARRRSEAVSLHAAARSLGMSVATVRRLCESGELRHQRFGRTYEIEASAIEEMLKVRARLTAEFVSTKEAASAYGIGWLQFQRLEEWGYMTSTRLGPRARLVQREELERAIERAQQHVCDVCGSDGLPPGRLQHRECKGAGGARTTMAYWHASDPETRAARGAASSAWIREWWQSPAGAQRRREMSIERNQHVPRRCSICGVEELRSRASALRADAQKRRTICKECLGPWTRALAEATGAARTIAPDGQVGPKLSTFRRVLAIGTRFEKEKRAQWPRQLGRRPPLALNIAIEAMHVAGFSDDETFALIETMADQGVSIPGLPTRPNSRYVTRRRQEAGIRRPASRFSV